MTTPPSRSLPPNFFLDATPFKIDGVYCKLVPLSGGRMYAVVDASDYPCVAVRAWQATWSKASRSYYATNKPMGGMHRFLLGLPKGDPLTADHVDPSRTWDNRRKNIRVADESQQKYNTRLRRDNQSGYKGVVWRPSRNTYFAQIRSRGQKNRYLGSDKDPAKCAEMYRVAAEKEHGEFARTS